MIPADTTIATHSDYDYHYKTYRCLYCRAPIALTPESLQILINEARDRILRDRTNFCILSPDQEEKLAKEVEERERGTCLSDKQCLHDRCLAIVQRADNSDLWTKIKAADRRFMVLPNVDEYNLYDVYYNSSIQAARHFCGYCHNMLTAPWPGFAYCKKSDQTKDCAFLHYSCFSELIEMRNHRLVVETQCRLAELQFLTNDLLMPERDIASIALRNDRWVRFMAKNALSDMERADFIDWFDTFFLKEKTAWKDQQRDQWALQHTEEDLETLFVYIISLSRADRDTLRERLSKCIIGKCLDSSIAIESQQPLLYSNLLDIQDLRDREKK